MSLTVVVKARSLMVIMRRSMSSGDMPAKDQMTLTTGMLISGKMSVDIRLNGDDTEQQQGQGGDDERVRDDVMQAEQST